MIDDYTKKEIEKISFDLLTQSKSIDVFPTPVEKILNYTELKVDDRISNLDIHPSFLEKLRDESIKILQSGLDKIKGIFDRDLKTIFVDESLKKNIGKKNFVELHEIGHGVLPWQNKVIMALDNNETLNEDIEEQFEQEANYFASITLFQQDRFIEQASKMKVGLDSVLSLKRKFGASVHATFRNYVLNSDKTCALLVLTPIDGAKWNEPICKLRNVFYSKEFYNKIGTLILPNQFGFKWDFVRLFKFKKKYVKNCKITVNTNEGEELTMNYHFFNNSYNVFIFLYL